jgi:hypothetical protein
MSSRKVFLGTFFFLILSTGAVLARPEYAAEAGIVNCGACHINPYGGGARNAEGKLYGSRDYRTTWLSRQDLFSLDMRGQEYWESRNSSVNKGVMIMNVIPTANLPLAYEKDEPPFANLVVSYNFAPVGPSLREAYYISKESPVTENSWISNVLFGDFQAPFGLFTDEHRTYTRQMVPLNNREFESGALMTGDPSSKVHYDLAVSSGFSNGGQGTNTHPDSWATFANFRHQIGGLPWHLGASYAVEGTTAAPSNLTATSLNSVFSFARYGGRHFRINLQAEAVWASGWDNSTFVTTSGDGISYFVPSTAAAWQTALTNANSFGYYALINWDLSRHWVLQFKEEQFTPDNGYQGDSFNRFGEGVRYYVNANANIILRHDYGYTTRSGLTGTDLAGIKAVGETYFALLHIWL